MTAKADVETDWIRDQLRIRVADDIDERRYILRFADVEIEEADPVRNDVDDKPLMLSEEQARALYEALARHFGGAPDMAVVRADLKHERDRVDRMIGFLEPRRA